MAQKNVGVVARVGRALFGKPIPTARAHHERLGPFLGLPVFSSDALSSVAYATEAILGVLVLYSAAALKDQIWITLAICLLIIIIATSYNQTIHAYPTGGGSYIVAKENLGESPGLVAGAALLIDYVLTVSVSIAAGVAAIVSAYPSLHRYLIPLSLLCIGIIAWANLRGVKESGRAFAVPTYGFILCMTALIVFGMFHLVGGPAVQQHVEADQGDIGREAGYWFIFVVLRSFAAGCTALTGIEAVSNGIQAFRPPESHNASVTLRWMTAILTFMFLGIGYLSLHVPTLTLYSTGNPRYMTVIAQIAAHTFGPGSMPFFVIQYFTAAILILAANTAFADFPRLSSLMGRDGYVPRPLARLGDRLVFHNGIVLLALAAGSLILLFKGELDALLPLYAVGVFTAFTLSQAGMVKHWFVARGRGWSHRAVINAVGAVLSGIVAVVILATKFLEGAWIVLILLIGLFTMFKLIKNRYASISKQLEIVGEPPARPARHTSLLMVPRVHRGIVSALEYALLLDPHCRAVHVAINDKALPEVRRMWEKYGEGVPLTILSTPHRSLVQPILDYVDEMLEEDPNQVITVIVPEAVSTKLFQKLLQENVAQQLRTALAQRKNVMVTNARYFLR
ncbi:MAG: APC family permease [Fimbriimonadales bacterium]